MRIIHYDSKGNIIPDISKITVRNKEFYIVMQKIINERKRGKKK